MDLSAPERRIEGMHPRFASAATVGLLVLAGLPATAAADGLPAVGIDAHPLGLPGGKVVYITKRAGHDTRLVEKARYGGPLRERRLHGSLSIPAVAYDGSPSGLSADGRKLVLISPRTRFPRRRTTFAVIDARRLTLRREISLRGDFSFDAISPDGRTMYLIEYDARDVSSYAVRAYDIRAGGLLPKPVVDPHEADEPMQGAPVTRVPGLDGRWAYTLYDSPGHPFVHALDTAHRTAVCIDLDDVGAVWGGTLTLHDNRLTVIDRHGRALAAIDTRTHKVIARKREEAAAAKRATKETDAGTSWLPLGAPAAALLLLAAVTRRRRTVAKAATGS
jgi:hypothetical protein